MQLQIQTRIKDALRSAIRSLFNVEIDDVVLNLTPKVELGELASPVCFELARKVKKAPRSVAEELIRSIGDVPGVRKIELAGAGYINFFLDRAVVFRDAFDQLVTHRTLAITTTDQGKVVVEHTNINPNKAAHIGHLRNAAIGDTFVRILKACGGRVEVQNYIDNTGVQVADVLVGFLYLEKKSVGDVRELIADPQVKFDYYCWDLYARVSAFYEAEDPKHALRARTLKEIEEDGNETAEMATLVAMTIVNCHLATMDRIGVRYDLLPRESDILHLKFWDYAFEQLKSRNAIFFENEGKNKGCWVMRIDTEGYDDDKIIVRSNGTVTYVGKDIAYQLWKLGLLEQDFHYRRLGGAHDVWVTSSTPGEPVHPEFGHGKTVYNVIDVRQSYLQNVVRQGLLGLGYEDQVKHSIHFSYEMVALTPSCAEQLGVTLSPEDRKRPHIEVSGRKGQGVKADDLLNMLEANAEGEVRQRNPDLAEADVRETAHQIAVGALRYFLLKFTRTAIIAFDFKEALNFDGETGPYLQYTAVRAGNILRKMAETDASFSVQSLPGYVADAPIESHLNEADDIWELIYTASRLDEIAAQTIQTLEPATTAKYAFTLAQRFNLFYHRYRVITEQDTARRMFYLSVLVVVQHALTKALDMMGIPVPRRM
ncbi:MAG TPA: arginine--tRNA ligase [Terriglobia bacterium]|nr:arginine--tRNA ligase [Terriglobia bacterium]